MYIYIIVTTTVLAVNSHVLKCLLHSQFVFHFGLFLYLSLYVNHTKISKIFTCITSCKLYTKQDYAIEVKE